MLEKYAGKLPPSKKKKPQKTNNKKSIWLENSWKEYKHFIKSPQPRQWKNYQQNRHS